MRLKFVFVLLMGVGVSLGLQMTQGSSFAFEQKTVCSNSIDATAYPFFAYATDSGMVIPGLDQNFVPQGIAYWAERDWYLISGYRKPALRGQVAGVIAVRGSDGKLVGEYYLEDRNGELYNGHFSGVAVSGRDLYVTGAYGLYRVSLQRLRRMGKKGNLRVDSWLPLAVDGGACSYANDLLWVSEHYEAKDYPLRGEHTVTAGDGTVLHAWMVGYRVGGEGLVPQCVFAVPDRVQGVAVLSDGRVVLSCSYGRTNHSEILICKDPTEETPLQWVTMDGQSVPLWCIDEKAVLQRVAAPPMSEGCCVVDDSVYILFESGAYYYREFTPGNTAVDPTDKIWRFLPP